MFEWLHALTSDTYRVSHMVNMGAFAALLILLIFANFGYLADSRGGFNFTSFHSSCNGSCNVTLEDKRGVPTGANPLHNRTEQTRCRELAKSSSFYRSVYSEIEEVGWEHLVRLGGDLTFLSFRVLDKKGRVHVMEIQLDKTYPKCPPSISADVPYIFSIEWSINSRLKDLVQQFQEHLEKLQEFWSTLDGIDKFLWVVNPKQAPRAMSCRQINVGKNCFIMLSINANDPRSLPECRFMGSGPIVNSVRKIWRRNSKRWMKGMPFLENLTCLLETQLPKPPDIQKNDQQVECGICYAQCLPNDDELGANSGSGTDYTCDNTNCSRAFHSVCLGDWLRSITTTRQSFNVLFGNCPYCSEPVAVKINNEKK